MKRYLVFAYYPNLGIHCRVTDYSNKNEMYEYISGLRFCETPYQAIDTVKEVVLDKELYGQGEEVKKILKEDLE